MGSVCEFTTVPVVALPPTTPLTSHVTVASCAPVTTELNVCVFPNATVAAVGDTTTLTVDRIVTDTDVTFDGSASGVATIRTVAGAGGNVGAVYTPLCEIAPQAAPPQPEPETDHVIVRLGFELAAGVMLAV